MSSFGGFAKGAYKDKNKSVGKALAHSLRMCDAAQELRYNRTITYPCLNKQEYIDLKSKGNEITEAEKLDLIADIEDMIVVLKEPLELPFDEKYSPLPLEIRVAIKDKIILQLYE